MISLPEFSLNKNPNWAVIKFIWRSVNVKHFMSFQSENAVYEFLQRGLAAALGFGL